MLTSSTGDELEGPRPLRKDELVDRVMAINCLEGKPFLGVLLGHQYHWGKLSLAEWWGREREILRQGLADVAGYEVSVPRRAPDPALVLERTAQIVDGLLE